MKWGNNVNRNLQNFLKQNQMFLFCFLLIGISGSGGNSVAELNGRGISMGFLWHLHQPLYWPAPISSAYPRMERAWETILRQDQGRNHPQPEKLRDIFSVDDRVQVYQWKLADSVHSMYQHPGAGVQISYSGSLIENITSLGENHAMGFSPQWANTYLRAAAEQQAEGFQKFDFVNFTFHHSLAPLISSETLEMELRLMKFLAKRTWGSESRGFFPTEMAFAEYLIPTLKKVGIEWVIVGNNHLARASQDYPIVLGSGGENCDLPNRADQTNPVQGSENYLRLQIDRGVSPAAPAPFAFTPHKVQYIHPITGESILLDVIPADQAFSWKDGYSSWDLRLTQFVSDRSLTQRPPFFLLAHDGDNAWGGGHSYYMEWIRELGQMAHNQQIKLKTVEGYLHEHPVPPTDIIHVESGAWVNAESDFGSPQFINWHWPPSYRSKEGRNIVDPSLGVSDKADFWRVQVATENSVKTAQQMARWEPRLDHVLNPVSPDTHATERGWHFYLGGLDSGFVYYGCHGDECERAVEAQRHALSGLRSILQIQKNQDQTGPTIFIPQRHPWNPGSKNFGVQYNYRPLQSSNNDFFVWTYIFDVSGVSQAKLFIRYNGAISPAVRETHLYGESKQLGKWQIHNLHERKVETVLKEKADSQADYFWIFLVGSPSGYADYYIEARDVFGNWTKTPIQHVYIGE